MEMDYDSVLPIAVLGSSNKLQRHIKRNEGHTLYQITLITDGEGVYINENGNEFPLKRGSVFMFRPNVAHEYYGTTENFASYWISIDGIGIGRMFDYIGVESSSVYDIHDEYEYNKIKLIFDEVNREYWAMRSDENTEINNGINAGMDYNKYRESELKASIAAYNLLGSTAILLNRQRYGNPKLNKGELAPVLEMIQKRYMENIGVSDMADYIGVSINKIAAMFKKSYGITPSRFLINTRLNFAEMFLRNMEYKTIKQISEMVGFNNSGYFIRVFKSKFGVTPEVYREMYTGKREV